MRKLAYLIACSLVLAGFLSFSTANATQHDCRFDQVNTQVSYNDQTKDLEYTVTVINDFGGSNDDCINMTVTASVNGSVIDTSILDTSTGFFHLTNLVLEPGDYNVNFTLYTDEAEPFNLDSTDRSFTVAITEPSGDTPLTALELDAFGVKFIQPIYEFLGMIVAIAVLYSAYAFVLKPWLRRFTR